MTIILLHSEIKPKLSLFPNRVDFMVEIIPNWHPIFVHFTVALFTAATVFYIFSYLVKNLHFIKLAYELEIVGKWCLWTTGIIVIGTILSGLYAYNTVEHDTPSHIVMTNHRNWAIPTAVAIILVSIWSIWRTYNKKAINLIFILAISIVQGMLLSTAWRGAELVFRYGIGVMALPKADSDARNHHPSEKMKEGKMDHSNMPAMEKPELNNHQHDHKD